MCKKNKNKGRLLTSKHKKEESIEMSELLKNILDSVCCGYNPFWDYTSSYITINARKYKLKRLLNENELSFVHLVEYRYPANQSRLHEDPNLDKLVLKQVLCPFGNINSVSNVLKEIENYKTFNSQYIIKCLDSQVVQRDDGSKMVLMLFPYYPRGSFQDLINYNLLDGSNQLVETEIIRLMIGICKGLLCLHDPTTREDMGNLSNGLDSVSIKMSEDAASLLDNTPLEMNLITSKNHKWDPFIHLNIKPSTILLTEENEPIISNMGSCIRGERQIKTDLDSTNLKQWASTHCNEFYMAPELTNIKKSTTIDCSVDIWSLGCLLYTLMFGISPFDREEQINGLPLRHNICKGIFSIPDNNKYSIKLVEIIKSCLQVDSIMRPTASELLTQLQSIPK